MILTQKIIFTKEECNSIVWENNNNIVNWDMRDRKYDSITINYSLENKWIFDKLITFFETETNHKLLKLKEKIHFHKYVKGDWFDKHNDKREGRIYTVGVLLNDEFEGGNFNIYNPNEQTLNKIIGNTYLFDVRIEHEITPILSGERYSLLWFLQSEHVKFDVNKLI
jgi:hypothetical protein